MDFFSVEFAIFFTFVIVGLFLLTNQKYQHFFLIAAGFFFYWTTSSFYLLILIYISVVTFYIGDAIYRSNSEKGKKSLLVMALVASLLFLLLFKYYNFSADTLNHLLGLSEGGMAVPIVSVILPIGISFYTFSGLSYVFDIYSGKIRPEEKLYKYVLFISYFPHLLAGPIVRAEQFLPQLNRHLHITAEGMKLGITLIAWGFFKKIVIADNLAPLVDSTFFSPVSGSSIAIITGTFLFGIQIYCDFSGYIDIALGCANIIGLHLPQNFNRPYFAKSPTEFWRRWNITLSSFMRDYVYIPLGGNRKGNMRTYVNLIVTMLISGLWHGAAWNFVIWGGYLGILLSIHRIMIHTRVSFGKTIDAWLETHSGLFFKVLFTQYLIFFGWLIFRVQNLPDLLYCSYKYLLFDFMVTQPELIAIGAIILTIMVFFALLRNRKFSDVVVKFVGTDWPIAFSELRPSYWFFYLVIIAVLLIMFSPSSSSEFIYFQF